MSSTTGEPSGDSSGKPLGKSSGTSPSRRSRPSAVARRIGYSIAIGVNLVLLYGVDVEPGWDVLPFLTADFDQVIGLVNASLVAGLVFNVLFLVYDPRWFKAAGDLVTTGLGMVVALKLLQVFPFELGTELFDWEPVVRTVLIVVVVLSALALIVQLVTLVRAVAAGESRR